MQEIEKDELAHKLADSGRIPEAISILKELEAESKDDPTKAAGYLLNQATCYSQSDALDEANACISKARALVSFDVISSAQIDYFVAIMLLERGEREQGLLALARILECGPSLFSSDEGRELYARIQVQRGLTLMHIPRVAEARPILEEAFTFQVEPDVKSTVH